MEGRLGEDKKLDIIKNKKKRKSKCSHTHTQTGNRQSVSYLNDFFLLFKQKYIFNSNEVASKHKFESHSNIIFFFYFFSSTASQCLACLKEKSL